MAVRSFVVSADELGSIRLDASGPVRREPPRPHGQRQPGYNEAFDYHTLFFDCFRLDDGTVRFMGPPPFNLKPVLAQAELKPGGDDRTTRPFNAAAIRCISRVLTIDVEMQTDAGRCDLVLPSGSEIYDVNISPSGTRLFEGRHVLMTMIKYDHLDWLRQWVEFYVRAHGVDAVLIYNNDAPDYSSSDIAATLEGITGLEAVGVVDWFFPYGPGAGASGRWDSAYAQVGAMEHARFRFLQRARSMINADVDELAFCHREGETLTALTAAAAGGYLCYPACWATAERGGQYALPAVERRFRDSYFINPDRTFIAGKWSLVPAMIPATHELGVHQVRGLEPDTSTSDRVSLRHMPEFNTGWKVRRKVGANMTQPDPVMQRTFGDIGWHS